MHAIHMAASWLRTVCRAKRVSLAVDGRAEGAPANRKACAPPPDAHPDTKSASSNRGGQRYQAASSVAAGKRATQQAACAMGNSCCRPGPPAFRPFALQWRHAHRRRKDAIRHHYQAIGKSLPGFRPRAASGKCWPALPRRLPCNKSRARATPCRAQWRKHLVVEGPHRRGQSTAYLLARLCDGQIARQKAGDQLGHHRPARAAGQPRFALCAEPQRPGGQLCPGQGARALSVPYRLYQHTADASQGELLAPDPNMLLWNHKPEKRELESSSSAWPMRLLSALGRRPRCV